MSSENCFIAQGFLSEIEAEFPATHKYLSRLSPEHLGWKPHEKSMTAGQLALHIAETPGMILAMGLQQSCEVPDLSNREQPESIERIISVLKSSEAELRKHLPSLSDDKMREIVRITKDGIEVAAFPRVGFLRQIMLNHWYHHRGQFGVYLRLLGYSVPAVYGPSADEG